MKAPTHSWLLSNTTLPFLSMPRRLLLGDNVECGCPFHPVKYCFFFPFCDRRVTCPSCLSLWSISSMCYTCVGWLLSRYEDSHFPWWLLLVGTSLSFLYPCKMASFLPSFLFYVQFMMGREMSHKFKDYVRGSQHHKVWELLKSKLLLDLLFFAFCRNASTER